MHAKQIICLQRSDEKHLFKVLITILLSLVIIIVLIWSDSLVSSVIIAILNNTPKKASFLVDSMCGIGIGAFGMFKKQVVSHWINTGTPEMLSVIE